jgi:lysophospholipase L1-like esterase
MAGEVGTPESRNPVDGSATIVCFGDSITNGFGVEPEQSFPAILGRILRVRVINAGLDGDTTEGGLARVESDVLRHQPDVVTVEFGANDYLMGVAEDEARRNIELMLGRIQESGARATVLSPGAAFWNEDYDAALSRAARSRDCPLLTGLLDGIAGNSMMTLDGLHPNAPGYIVIARKIADFLRQAGLLGETRPAPRESERHES